MANTGMYNRTAVFWAACAGMLFFGISLITLGSVVPGLTQKFRLDEMAAGTLFSILPFGILAGSLLFGPLCDKYGYKALLVFSCCSMFIGFEGIAYAPTRVLLTICILLFGVGAGAINGATNAVVSDISEKDKGANLSLLGVFFGVGALGMPFVLGLLQHRYNYESIVSFAGFGALFVGICLLRVKFPPPKQAKGLPVARSISLVKDGVLILIAFFLFCQSSFEAIINNWTTTYLSKQLSIQSDKALYSLSLFVLGMTAMRLLLGSALRKIAVRRIWTASFLMILLGLFFLALGRSYYTAITGLISLGAGLAAGFPVMLGFVGNRYRSLSATAFSLVLVIALLGNILVNYGMGIIAQTYGVRHLITVSFIELAAMITLCTVIVKKLKHHP